MTLLFIIANFRSYVPRPIIMPYNIGFFQHRLTKRAALEEYIPRDGRGFVVFMTVKYTEWKLWSPTNKGKQEINSLLRTWTRHTYFECTYSVIPSDYWYRIITEDNTTANKVTRIHFVWTYNDDSQWRVIGTLLTQRGRTDGGKNAFSVNFFLCDLTPAEKEHEQFKKKKESDSQLEKPSVKLSFFLHFYVFPFTLLFFYLLLFIYFLQLFYLLLFILLQRTFVITVSLIVILRWHIRTFRKTTKMHFRCVL